MEVKDISKMLNTNIDRLKEPEIYKNILFKGNNLIRFDILNRILIEIQFKDAFDIRTYNEWILDGRKIGKKAKPIYILMPRYEHTYIDTETGNKIDMNELNIKEFNKALEYGIIKKDTEISHLYTIPMYDIKQTQKSETRKEEYEVNKPILSSSDIIKLTSELMDCHIDICNLKNIYFNKDKNTLFITKLPYEKLVSSISKILSKFYINNKLIIITEKACEINYLDLTDADIDLIDFSIQYSINTLFSGDNTYSSKKVEENLRDNIHSNEKLIDILNIVDTVMYDITRRIKFTKEFNTDAIGNVHKIRKAGMLLSEMEASELNSIINNK